MKKKLQCVIVDDDPFTLNMVKDLCEDSPITEVTATFLSPKDFLDVHTNLNYNVCILDICMPEMDGITVSKQIPQKPIIFMTGHEGKLKNALETNHIAVLTKPVIKQMFLSAVNKASMLNSNLNERTHEFEAFNVLGSSHKQFIKISDILYVKVAETDCRNKVAYLSTAINYTIMNYSMQDILSLSDRLIQINKFEVISIDSIVKYGRDIVVIEVSGKQFELTLNRTYRRAFLERTCMI